MSMYNDEEKDASEILETLIPDATRKTCLQFLAGSILTAHKSNSDRWGITLSKDFVRLNVGKPEVISIYSHFFHIILDVNLLPREFLPPRNARPFDKRLIRWKAEDLDFLGNKNGLERGVYSSTPGSIICNLKYAQCKSWLPVLEIAHHGLIQKAAQTPRNGMTQGSHAPAIINYLSTYLKQDIPQPGYIGLQSGNREQSHSSPDDRSKPQQSVKDKFSGKQLLHMCIGSTTDAERILTDAETSGNSVVWIVPSKARAGDEVLFYIPGRGLVASGLVVEDASKARATGWPNRYGSVINEITVFRDAISLESIIEAIPEWLWPTYPRITATPSESIAQKIRDFLREHLGHTSPLPDVDLSGFSATEGAKRLRTHLTRERNPALVKAKKSQVLAATGRLACEVCGFDFEAFYGESGKEFCEVHHLLPLSQIDKQMTTTLQDLAVVCSNCHRMLHRGRNLKSPAELKKLILANR